MDLETLRRRIGETMDCDPVGDCSECDQEGAYSCLRIARVALAAIGPAQGRDAVIEECAQWHDKQHGAWLDQARNAQLLSQNADEAEAHEYRQQHERFAAYAIIHRQSAEEFRRALASPEKASTPAEFTRAAFDDYLTKKRETTSPFGPCAAKVG